LNLGGYGGNSEETNLGVGKNRQSRPGQMGPSSVLKTYESSKPPLGFRGNSSSGIQQSSGPHNFKH
jgi:hypothetical protein